MRRTYLDYVSLTPVDKKVLGHMKKYMKEDYMNPSSLYASGVSAKKALNEAKEVTAKIIHAHADEIVFTGSGTEANNLALRGVIEKSLEQNKRNHIVVSAIEHSSIIETARSFEKKGIKVSYVPVDKNGVIDLDEFKKSLTTETVLVSIMMVNNEIGTIEPIQEIAKIIRNFRKQHTSSYPIFHTDACQAALYFPLHVEKLGVDMLTLDAHKMYGPRGVGMLYVKRGIELEPVIYGGGQEKGLRAGTENIPGIQGFFKALEVADALREKEFERVNSLREYFIQKIKGVRRGIDVHGESETTAPHIVNISIPNIDNEFFVLQLDAKGISCSTKSACLRDEDESYVLKALGLNDSKNSVRFSFGRETRKGDIDHTIKVIDGILPQSL